MFDALLYFVENPGRVIEKDDFLSAVWGGRFVEEANLSQTIFVLRKALKDAGEDNNLIATVPGRGYSFTADVQRSDGDSFPGNAISAQRIESIFSKATGASASPDSSATSLLARRGSAIAVVCALLLVAGGGLYYVVERSGAPIRARASKTLVLADFQNLTGDATLGVVLGKALQIELAQSPYLNLLTQQRVGETLQQMERPKDATLTPALSQEVCARNQGDAALAGTVARMGARYLVTLEAKDCAQGATIIAASATVDREEDLPGALDGITTRAREALQESPESIRRFNKPIAHATTSSFAALKAYSLGVRLRVHADNWGAIQAFKHAIELDPSFALAWENLSNCYSAMREFVMADAALRKAFALRDHTNEYERFGLVALYDTHMGNWEEATQAYRLWTQTYPNDWAAWSDFANHLISKAHYDEAIEAGRVALRLNPDHYRSYMILVRAYKRANRFADAKALAAVALQKGLDSWDLHGLLYEIAYREADTKTMAAQVAKEKGQPTETYMLEYQADAAATSGQLRRSQELFAQAIALARSQGPDSREEVGNFYNDAIEMADFLGARDEAVRIASTATAEEKVNFEPLAFASYGDYNDARASADAAAAQNPDSTPHRYIELPRALGAVDLGQNRPADAITALQSAIPYQLGDFWTPSLLARAYLATNAPERAAAEYRLILANRGVDALSPQYPLAYLGLARSLHMEHKDAESRVAYQQLFAFWKSADNDLPVLRQAKAEYSKL